MPICWNPSQENLLTLSPIDLRICFGPFALVIDVEADKKEVEFGLIAAYGREANLGGGWWRLARKHR